MIQSITSNTQLLWHIRNNKILASAYVALTVVWFAFVMGFYISWNQFLNMPLFTVTGLLPGLALILFSFFHWRIVKNSLGTMIEKSLVAISIVNIILVVAVFLFSAGVGCKSEGCVIILPAAFLLVIASVSTFILGIASNLTLSKRASFWVVLILIIVPVLLETLNVIFWS